MGPGVRDGGHALSLGDPAGARADLPVNLDPNGLHSAACGRTIVVDFTVTGTLVGIRPTQRGLLDVTGAGDVRSGSGIPQGAAVNNAVREKNRKWSGS